MRRGGGTAGGRFGARRGCDIRRHESAKKKMLVLCAYARVYANISARARDHARLATSPHAFHCACTRLYLYRVKESGERGGGGKPEKERKDRKDRKGWKVVMA